MYAYDLESCVRIHTYSVFHCIIFKSFITMNCTSFQDAVFQFYVSSEES